MTKTQLEAIIKPDEVVTAYEHVVNGQDEHGYDTYKIVYIENPQNYQLIHLDVDSKHAILKDLDYVEPKA